MCLHFLPSVVFLDTDMLPMLEFSLGGVLELGRVGLLC